MLESMLWFSQVTDLPLLWTYWTQSVQHRKTSKGGTGAWKGRPQGRAVLTLRCFGAADGEVD